MIERKNFFGSIISGLLGAALALCLSGCDKNISQDLGGAKMNVPIPYGYRPVSKLAPHFFEITKNSHSKISVVLEYFLTQSDLNDVISEHSKFRKKSLILMVPRDFYGRAFSEDDFNEIALMQRLVGGNYVKRIETYQNEKNEIEEQKSGVVPVLSSGRKWLGIVIDQHDAIGDATEQVVHDGAYVTTRVTVSILTRVADRLVSIKCESVVKDDRDIKSIENTCSKWSKNILEANSVR